MSLLQKKINSQQSEKQYISKKIENENIKPTENEQKTAKDIIKELSEKYSDELIKKGKDEIENELASAIVKMCSKLDISFEEQKRIEKTVLMTVLGHGPIEVFLQDPEVSEIIVQHYDNVVVEKNGKLESTDVTFNNEEHLQTIIKRIVQRADRQVNISSPIVDTRLEDGSRVNAVLPPVSVDGATLDIRKFTKKALSGADYVRLGSLNREMLYFLERCVRGRINIFVSGGTGTGKTTLLNMLSSFIPKNELIVTIEDTCELQLQQPNVRRREIRPSTTDGMLNVNQKLLVKNALRERPDRIILGEIRDGTIVDLVSAMSTGHDGSMTTAHANSPANLCNIRIPILYSWNPEVNFSEKSIALQVAEALQIIVQIKRFKDGTRRITHISHVSGVDAAGKVYIKDIFRYDEKKNQYYLTGYIPRKIIEIIKDNRLEFEESILKKDKTERVSNQSVSREERA